MVNLSRLILPYLTACCINYVTNIFFQTEAGSLSSIFSAFYHLLRQWLANKLVELLPKATLVQRKEEIFFSTETPVNKLQN